MALVFLGIGSNIDAEANLPAAAQLLRSAWHAIRFSHIYRSAAREVKQQEFLNAVALIQTQQKPPEVASQLRTIEQALGKQPPFRFGPRTIDLDLLLYDADVSSDAALTIPHPRMHERRFVLEPLCELLDPATEHPLLHRSFAALLEGVREQHCVRIPLEL